MNIELVKEVLSDEEFVKSLVYLEDGKEVQAKLKEKGIDLSVEQLKEIHDFVVRYSKNELTPHESELLEQAKSFDSGELDENQLESVSGGFNGVDAAEIFLGLIASLSCPVLAPILGVAAYDDIKEKRSSW